MAESSDSLTEQPRAMRAVIALNEFVTRHVHHLSVLTPCPLPAKGPAILVSNHTAGIDPLMLQSACPRLIVWMMAKEYYDIRALRWLFEALQTIPVERSGRDMAAMRAALRVLEQGRILGVFPEGRIERTRELMPFQTGVGLLAAKSGAPVFPAFLDGRQRGREMVASLLHPSQASVAFGPEIALDRSDTSREGLERMTAAIQGAVQALRDRFPEPP